MVALAGSLSVGRLKVKKVSSTLFIVKLPSGIAIRYQQSGEVTTMVRESIGAFMVFFMVKNKVRNAQRANREIENREVGADVEGGAVEVAAVEVGADGHSDGGGGGGSDGTTTQQIAHRDSHPPPAPAHCRTAFRGSTGGDSKPNG
jgi:hypothetical protein